MDSDQTDGDKSSALEPEQEWRLQLSAIPMQVLAVVLLIPAFVAMASDQFRGERHGPLDFTFAVAGLMLVGNITYLTVAVLRTRVRLLDRGVEVREWRTRLYPYTSIHDVVLDRGSNDRTILLRLSGAESLTLPAPVRRLGRRTDPRLDDALRTIRTGCGLDPDSRRLP